MNGAESNIRLFFSSCVLDAEIQWVSLIINCFFPLLNGLHLHFIKNADATWLPNALLGGEVLSVELLDDC